MGKHSVHLTICGTECVVSSEEDEAYMQSIAQEVKERMEGLQKQNSHASATVAGIVAALSYCDECRKATTEVGHLRGQIKEYVEDSTRARREAQEAASEIGRLKKEIATLRARLGENPEIPSEELQDAPLQSSRTGSFSRPEQEITPEQEGFLKFFEDADES